MTSLSYCPFCHLSNYTEATNCYNCHKSFSGHQLDRAEDIDDNCCPRTHAKLGVGIKVTQNPGTRTSSRGKRRGAAAAPQRQRPVTNRDANPAQNAAQPNDTEEDYLGNDYEAADYDHVTDEDAFARYTAALENSEERLLEVHYNEDSRALCYLVAGYGHEGPFSVEVRISLGSIRFLHF